MQEDVVAESGKVGVVRMKRQAFASVESESVRAIAQGESVVLASVQ